MLSLDVSSHTRSRLKSLATFIAGIRTLASVRTFVNGQGRCGRKFSAALVAYMRDSLTISPQCVYACVPSTVEDICTSCRIGCTRTDIQQNEIFYAYSIGARLRMLCCIDRRHNGRCPVWVSLWVSDIQQQLRVFCHKFHAAGCPGPWPHELFYVSLGYSGFYMISYIECKSTDARQLYCVGA